MCSIFNKKGQFCTFNMLVMASLSDRIGQFFNPFQPAPAALWEGFAERMHFRRFEKNEIVKESGDTERYLSFVVAGVGGVFAWRDEREVCLDFSFENQFFGDYASFLRQGPSPVFTQAVEPLEMYSIAHHDLEQLYAASPEGIRLARAAAESLFIESQQRQLDLLTKTAEERYRELLAHYPDALLRLPQKHIASWLGITPESLSRIRKVVASE